MPSLNNYTSHAPSPNCAVTNGAEPAGFLLISAQPQENVPVDEIPTLTRLLRPVGLPTVGYSLRYFTMSAVTSALAEEYAQSSPALQFAYFGKFVNNVFMIGGSLQASPVAEGNGVVALTLVQNLIALSQRAAYPAP